MAVASEAIGPSDPPRRFVDVHGGPASYTDEGSGPAVVLVHGLPGSARDFRWLAPRLAEGARVLRLELPGFGETPVATEPDPSPEARGRFIVDCVEALGLDRPWLVGHSMGGVAAVAAVDQSEGFGGLGLLASPGLDPHPMQRWPPFRAMNWLMTRPILGPALAPLVRRAFALGGFRGYPDSELYRTIRCVAATDLDAHGDRVVWLSLPTLVAWCDDDPIIPPAFSIELGEVCPEGPRLGFATGGHNLQKSRAEEVAEALLALLESKPPPARAVGEVVGAAAFQRGPIDD